MIFTETKIPGAVLIRPQPSEDERGFFARTFCLREFAEHGIDSQVAQRSVSSNRRRGTLRGMHFQAAPHEENKLVFCSRGAIFDVIVDLRRDSPAYRQWLGVTLSADGLESLFVPAGCAHGFLTLADDCHVRYDISAFYVPEAARGLRYDDPAFAIEWPFAPVVISARDLAFPPFEET
ncbi:MAG: dTDP-4-dehydrorhamnose 3,5-epimerase [Myxococcales bacterium]|jgi:dTDP-4-dehydrorhamnose 3,5-epimerase|nr:dTDP-4-dehydrorhamnose 3,5-epimerase [Myxococcales bacterium]